MAGFDFLCHGTAHVTWQLCRAEASWGMSCTHTYTLQEPLPATPSCGRPFPWQHLLVRNRTKTPKGSQMALPRCLCQSASEFKNQPWDETPAFPRSSSTTPSGPLVSWVPSCAHGKGAVGGTKTADLSTFLQGQGTGAGVVWMEFDLE